MLGMAGSENVQGEDQKKLDVLANDVFINLLRKCGQCGVLVRLSPTPSPYSCALVKCIDVVQEHRKRALDCDDTGSAAGEAL